MLGDANGFKEQYERMNRWRLRLNQYGDQLEYKDNMWAFFQNAYHLKDWIYWDKGNKDAETFIDNNKIMRICGDLANRSKHLKLTTPKGQKLGLVENADCNSESVTVGVTTQALFANQSNIPREPHQVFYPSSVYAYEIETANGDKYNHLVLADLIIQEWKTYLTSKGYL